MNKTGQFRIPIVKGVVLLVDSSGAPLFEEADAADYGESRWQLQEGQEYDYEFINAENDLIPELRWRLEGPDTLLKQKPFHANRGKIVTGIYVGTVHFVARRNDNAYIVPVTFEIQSVKINYRADYRIMLNEITKYYTDLVMQQGSQVTQEFQVDETASCTTLYQKFSFVRSIVEDIQFDEAIHKIISNPVRKLTDIPVERHIESVHRISRSGMRQIASRKDRVLYSFIDKIDSLPRYLTVNHKTDSIDTIENQFIKYVLTCFYDFCSSLATKRNANEQLKKEVNVIGNVLQGYMNSLFFKAVSTPTSINIGSPVLQRKEGYREVLQAWLMFDLAAKLTWSGGDKVYNAGMKNVAVLYEYWVFFKLLDCVSEVFGIPTEEKSKLINSDADHINLNLDLSHGNTKVLEGSTTSLNRHLRVRLCYNKIFNYKKDGHQAGSWTTCMRPDYTLSVWPEELTVDEAESNDTIIHIHFDAKYRLDKKLIGEQPDNLEGIQIELKEEEENRERDVYRKGDLLKMHAYKDAIRRTGGAYILYPGNTKEEIHKGFEEIIPGLGAFCLSPGHDEDQIPAIKTFLEEVVDHFANRTTKREKAAHAVHGIYEQKSTHFYDSFPEPYLTSMFPDDILVLVGCYKNEDHLKWILSEHKYNIRFGGPRQGAISLDDKYLNARYLLLYSLNNHHDIRIFKVLGKRPDIVTDKIMNQWRYPSPTPDQMYMVYNVSEDEVEPELKNQIWDIHHMVKKNGAPGIDFFTNLVSRK
ncbi:MAG: DUF2357 domain-containing protein [Bacteroidales bacterium]|nr:DUF2357 domain-containing protein [Bacteroidales bacterium]